MHVCKLASGTELRLQELEEVHQGNTIQLFCMIDADNSGSIERSDWIGWFVQLGKTCGDGERSLSNSLNHTRTTLFAPILNSCYLQTN